MLNKLTQMLQDLQNSQNVFDPAQFGDPIAAQTGWRPVRGGGSNFRTFKLVMINPHRMEFKTTIGAILFSLIFALPGIGVLILFIPNADWTSITAGTIIPLFLGLIFTILGGYLFYSQMLPIVFDTQEGLFWKNRKPQGEMLTNEATTKYVRLDSVHALQIVAEYIKSKNGGYYSYELNLVLKNGARINLVDHGKRNKLAADTKVLAEFLGIPVWDATIKSSPCTPEIQRP